MRFARLISELSLTDAPIYFDVDALVFRGSPTAPGCSLSVLASSFFADHESWLPAHAGVDITVPLELTAAGERLGCVRVEVADAKARTLVDCRLRCDPSVTADWRVALAFLLGVLTLAEACSEGAKFRGSLAEISTLSASCDWQGDGGAFDQQTRQCIARLLGAQAGRPGPSPRGER
jgi:hypothetical protein